MTIRRLKEENYALSKEESKGRSTDLSGSPAENTGVDLILTQLHNNPQLRAALLTHLQSEAAADMAKLDPVKKRKAKYTA